MEARKKFAQKRKDLNLSLREVAKKAGMSSSWADRIGRYEKGKYTPKSETLEKWAKALQLKLVISLEEEKSEQS